MVAVAVFDEGDERVVTAVVVERTVGGEQRRITFGIAAIDGMNVARVELLDLDIILRRQRLLGVRRTGNRYCNDNGRKEPGQQQHAVSPRGALVLRLYAWPPQNPEGGRVEPPTISAGTITYTEDGISFLGLCAVYRAGRATAQRPDGADAP